MLKNSPKFRGGFGGLGVGPVSKENQSFFLGGNFINTKYNLINKKIIREEAY